MGIKLLPILVFLQISFTSFSQISIAFPPARMVYQRNQAGNATVFITGTYIAQIDRIEARLKTRSGEPGSEVGWIPIVNNPAGNVFSGSLNSAGGRFDLEVRGMKNNQQVGTTSTVEKVGVGEVFLIVGHSNASGANSAMKGSGSDLVNSINTKADNNLYQQYLRTGSPDYLPPLKPSGLCQDCGIAPMAQEPWFWSQLGDLLVDALHVPILFYSAAFGGTNMGHFYKAAYNIPFSHGFINYSIRMPYVNIRNTMSKYVPRTGLRAILSAHGINDIDTTGAGFYFRNLKVIEKSREESTYQNLAWVIATAAYNNGIKQDITDAQNSLIQEVPQVYRGADLNQIDNSGRYDGLHFNEAGQAKAAELWRDAITSSSTNLLGNAQSFMAQPPPLPDAPLPVTMISFEGKTLEDGHNRLEWATTSETNNDHFEVLKSKDAVNFTLAGTIKGVGNSNIKNSYSYTDESIPESIMYYRLNQVDLDGTETLSRIISVKTEIPDFKEFVFPNPAQHTIEIAVENGETVENLTIYDLKGSILMQQLKSSQMDISALNKGDYFIQIRMKSGELVRKKITKL